MSMPPPSSAPEWLDRTIEKHLVFAKALETVLQSWASPSQLPLQTPFASGQNATERYNGNGFNSK